jgi:hypothetical protein
MWTIFGDCASGIYFLQAPKGLSASACANLGPMVYFVEWLAKAGHDQRWRRAAEPRDYGW